MTLLKPKTPRRAWNKNLVKCLDCGCFFEADGRGRAVYCKACSLKRFQESNRRSMEKRRRLCFGSVC